MPIRKSRLRSRQDWGCLTGPQQAASQAIYQCAPSPFYYHLSLQWSYRIERASMLHKIFDFARSCERCEHESLTPRIAFPALIAVHLPFNFPADSQRQSVLTAQLTPGPSVLD